jgi:hypothetical protein
LLIASSANVFRAEHRQLPNAGSLVVANEIRVTVRGLQFEIPIVGREPGVDHLGDVDATIPKDQTAWRLLAAVARVALDANTEQLAFRHQIKATTRRFNGSRVAGIRAPRG